MGRFCKKAEFAPSAKRNLQISCLWKETLRGPALARGQIFDTIAATYDAQRSGYPPQLFSDLVALARLEPGDRVLEIGCGSGQATVGFFAKGMDITGVDPGASLVELARAKFADAKSVRFEVSTFEQWARGGRQYNLVAAGQSWHWLAADAAFAKAAQALAPKGALAISGHTPVWSAGLAAFMEPHYARWASDLIGPPPEAWYLPGGPVADLIRASGRFARLEHREYEWRSLHTAASFAAYLGTRSDHLILPPGRRADLLSNVENGLPVSVEADWVTNLYFAERA